LIGFTVNVQICAGLKQQAAILRSAPSTSRKFSVKINAVIVRRGTMPKQDKDLLPGFDVQVIPVSPTGVPATQQGTAPVPVQAPNGNGYVVTSAPNTPIILVPPQQAPQPAQPSLVVITLAPKKEEEKKEKKSSSVFQRL
jgi:hypothetical protein